MKCGQNWSEWEKASTFTKLSFSVANPMLCVGQEKPLEFDQLLLIPRKDRSDEMLPLLREAYKNSKPFWFLPRLMVALMKFRWVDLTYAALMTIADATSMLITPYLLRRLLAALVNGDSNRQCYMWAALLTGVGFFQVLNRHVFVFVTTRVGWNWKNATTALIHDKLIQMDVNILQSSGSGTGMMVNMISNDVARFEEFPIFIGSFWVALLAVVAVLIELIFVLDVPSAFAGVGTSIIMLPAMMYFAKLFAKYRGQTAASTDSRVRYISEVIEGIASVKSYAWETAFFQMIRKLRAQETKYIGRSQVIRAINQAFIFCMPALVSFATFGVFWGNGGELT
eukprot:gene29578-33398_t